MRPLLTALTCLMLFNMPVVAMAATDAEVEKAINMAMTQMTQLCEEDIKDEWENSLDILRK